MELKFVTSLMSSLSVDGERWPTYILYKVYTLIGNYKFKHFCYAIDHIIRIEDSRIMHDELLDVVISIDNKEALRLLNELKKRIYRSLEYRTFFSIVPGILISLEDNENTVKYKLHSLKDLDIDVKAVEGIVNAYIYDLRLRGPNEHKVETTIKGGKKVVLEFIGPLTGIKIYIIGEDYLSNIVRYRKEFSFYSFLLIPSDEDVEKASSVINLVYSERI